MVCDGEDKYLSAPNPTHNLKYVCKSQKAMSKGLGAWDILLRCDLECFPLVPVIFQSWKMLDLLQSAVVKSQILPLGAKKLLVVRG